MTYKPSKPYQFSHVRLFHLAAFFRDHGWIPTEKIYFNANQKLWFKNDKFAAESVPLSLSEAVQVFTAMWSEWWKGLPTLQAGFTNSVAKVKSSGDYEAYFKKHSAGTAKTVAHAIRNAVVALKKQAIEARATLKAQNFASMYGMKSTIAADSVIEMMKRLDTVIKALSPNKPQPPSDSEIDAAFPYEGKKKYFDPEYKGNAGKVVGADVNGQTVLTEGPVDQMVLDALKAKKAVQMLLSDADVAEIKKGMPLGFGKLLAVNANGDAFEPKDLVGKSDAPGVEFKTKYVEHLNKPKNLEAIFGKVKADEIKVLEDKAFDAANEAMANSDAKMLGEIKSLKQAKNFLIQAEAAEAMKLLEPTGKASEMLKSMTLDLSKIEAGLMQELMAFPNDVKVEAEPGVEPGSAKLKVSLDPAVPMLKTVSTALMNTLSAMMNYGISINQQMLKQVLLGGNASDVFSDDDKDAKGSPLSKLKRAFTKTCNQYKALMKQQSAQLQKEAANYAMKLLEELEAQPVAPKGLSLKDVVQEMKAKGISVDGHFLQKAAKKYGEKVVVKQLLKVLEGKESASPHTPVTYKKDSPALKNMADDEVVESSQVQFKALVVDLSTLEAQILHDCGSPVTTTGKPKPGWNEKAAAVMLSVLSYQPNAEAQMLEAHSLAQQLKGLGVLITDESIQHYWMGKDIPLFPSDKHMPKETPALLALMDKFQKLCKRIQTKIAWDMKLLKKHSKELSNKIIEYLADYPDELDDGDDGGDKWLNQK